ncbi:Transcription initiation factor IIA subunit 1 [Tupaia chinensis]|uniref:Transcription initiation factor IIA subunit 1 n=1 Tax=Tupaia chinensis TaxID=246437 RepID=L9JH52_TUPCH|nr:Transcription initiation factor IIA subunit 1 [Tupaia chinensis]
MELKTLWENKLMQSRAVDGFHSDEQQLLLPVQQQHQPQQQQHHHHHHHQQTQPQQTVPQQAQTQQVLIPASQQATAPQVIVPDSKLIQHMNASNMSAAATAATLALPAGVTPVQQILTNSGQLLQVVRAANGAQYIFQPQQSVVLQQQVIPQMQPGGVQAPVIQQSAAATAATLALPAGVTPVQQILTNSGQLLQVVRAANGAQYIFQPQQSVVLQQQVIPQMQPGGVQAPVIQQVLAPLPGGISPQTGVIIQPQQILFTGNKTQVIPTTVAAPTPAQAQITAAGQQQPQAQPAQTQAPLVLQVDGTGDTSSEEDEDEEEDYDDDEEEDKEKDGAEDGQVEEEPLNSEDDVSDEEGQELFDTENVVVCQYDKIHRSKNKWKFHLKDGIMNLNGRDYIFSKAIGDAEW